MSLQPGEPIAIVGSACRFAGSTNSPSKLWDLLRQPRDLRREVPATRFSVRGFYHPDGSYHGHSNVSHAYILDDDDENDPSKFDSDFFGIKPVEARAMDPQQRVLLEIVYEALESAGLPIERLRGSDTAVYVGSMTDDYTALLLRDLQDTPTYTATGTARSMLSNRISHVFDWRGPSVSLDTACSASLVAVHLAVQTLRAGESRTAVACGANLILGPENFIIESKLNMLSPDGRSKMWDQGANGYARGEGVAAVVLKTLRAALEDGDHVECIIRETGLNQDGATPGITMPSAAAQQALIQKTYSKAGLDLAQRSDRPQYFEAHGTGTPAGDPVEAEAIYNALGSLPLNPGEQPLYVGSIKTVLGHTEGTAGVAAILKASLALQHACIPPNLWFETLSARVAPFYKNVEIPVASRPWPPVAAGEPRRASVNSFGFGGANVHAILESYIAESRVSLPTGGSLLFTPFVFSASSQQSLTATLRAQLEFLDQYNNNNNENREDLDPHDLLWTLQQRRSVLGWRMAITVPALEELPVKLRACLTYGPASIGVRALPASSNRILGVFTGQGAQYARMGAELIQHSETARGIILRLDSYLRELPDGDRPAWSLESELMADESSSRVHEASISQPLCTAVQILLVDLLRLGGVRFSAVVGHSSGEIAAAYSAGFLTARDAICIAYYRGFHLQKASSPHGHHIKGAMLAVGTSAEDATELCMDRVFKGRIVVAAINSPSSVTIAGDEDAIAELETILEDEKIFFRRLRVDRAYHSPHMLPCADPYVESLRRCGVTMQTPKSDDATWFSTVYEGMTGGQATSFGAEYWAENMTKPVLFSQGVNSAIAAQSCDLVVEVGPHPALKGPTSQTIQRVLGKELPYHGTLSRGASAVEAMSSLLGLLWMYLDPSCVNLNGYERAMNGVNLDRRPPRLVKGLPTYRWDHGVRHWHESRRSRKMRQRVHRVHPLLGDVSPDSTSHCMSWNHFLSVSEMEWLDGHRVQGGAVFPAAGYVCTALEAARFVAESVCPGKKICLVELGNFTIHQAVTFDDVAKRVEVLVSMHDIERPRPDRISATFNYSAALGGQQDDQELTLAASCRVHVVVGDTTSFSLLPTRKPDPPNMLDVETERFYAALADLGYGFSGRFRSLSSMYRKHGRSTCELEMAPREEGYENLLIHPAELDAMLQSIMLARSHPYDEELRKMHLPTAIRQIRVNPSLLIDGAANLKRVTIKRAAIDSVVQEPEVEARGITGHADLYSSASAHAAIQIQGATFMPLGGIGPEDDRKVFSKVHWVRSQPDGEEAAQQISLDRQHYETVKVLERIAVFYLRKFSREFFLESGSLAKTTSEDHALYLKFAQYVASVAESGGNPWIEKSWLEDTLDDVMEASKPFSHIPDVHMMHLVGAEMPKVFAGETTMLEQFRTDGENILDKYYTGGFGVRDSAAWVGRTVKQIADRYAHMNILEIGAGTGGGTKAIFREIGDGFLTYTYTDISTAFFEDARSTFTQHKNGMIFKTLDIERDPLEQGYTEGSYDLIVAFLMLHATSDVGLCLSRVRKLLKPGGYLVVAEGHDAWDGFARAGFIWGTLPGWWLRAGEGEQTRLSPHLSPKEWDEQLRATGFSGVDTCLPSTHQQVFSQFCFVSRATNDQVRFLQQPLLESSPACDPIQKLVVVGGDTPRTRHLVEGLQSIFAARSDLASEIYHFTTLLDVDYSVVDAGSTVVSLTELDRPVFKDITPKAFASLKSMFGTGKTLLWITSGRLEHEPFSNMTVGFGNVAVNETPDLHLQQLEIKDPVSTRPETIAEILLRFHNSTTMKTGKLVWTVEPEIVLDERGREIIPRIRPIPELNDRYNSATRPIVRDFESGKLPSTVVLQRRPASGEFVLRQQWPDPETQASEPGIELRTTHATLFAVPTPLGHKFVVLAQDMETKGQYLALVSSSTSLIRLPQRSIVPCPSFQGCSDAQVMSLVSAHLTAMHLLHPMSAGQTLVAHDPSNVMARALEIQAGMKGVRVLFTTEASNSEAPETWVRLPGYVTQYDLGEMLLRFNPSAFVGFVPDDDSTEKGANQAALIECPRNRCQILTTVDAIYSSTGSDSGLPSDPLLGEVLRQALEYVRRDLDFRSEVLYLPDAAPRESFRLSDIVRGHVHPNDPLSAVDWTAAADNLPVHICRLDSKPMFKSNASYWIVGMSRALGLSLADWMISKGAKTVILTSRKPDIDPRWIALHRANGANVVILPCDVTDEPALRSVHAKICASLPPIAGVINGAMVLRDTTISKMTFNQLMDVLRPKVDGSINLDRIFHDTDLDFFVLMSSINRVYGNHGQANYAAANSFMWSLAANRRKRGLRAATVDIGAIIGAGYLARELRRELDAIVKRYNMLRLSEEDWCQAICEAIDASRLESHVGPGLTSGFAEVAIDAPNPPSWHSNPVFSAFVVARGAVQEKGVVKAGVEIGEQLRACQTLEQVWQVVERSFATQMRSILQVTTSDERLMAMRSNELGLDSLVSVDIRSWFRKNLQVNVPVLKIMGNDTLASIVQYAVDNIPSELVPGLAAVDGISDAQSSGDQTLQAGSDDEGLSTLNEKWEASATPTKEGTINWELESRPPADLADMPVLPSPQRARNPPHVVVLTGCTGLLGHHLISYFLTQPTIEKVICLAVRSLPSRIKNGTLPSNDPRVIYHAGDLSQPLLGLSPSEAADIFAFADTVVHNAADTSHLKSYADLRVSNVGSTTALARLCLPRRIPLHYVSSAGLGLWHKGKTGFLPGPVELAPGWQPDGSFGYLCSKWTCERLLERVSAEYGLPVCIHRPSTIVREGRDAMDQRAEKDWINAFLVYARRLKAVPRAVRNRGNLDLVYVGSVCEAIIEQLFGRGGEDDTPEVGSESNGDAEGGNVTYVHEVGDRRLPLGELHHVISRDKDDCDPLQFRALDGEEWLAQATAAGLHPGVAALIESMIDEKEDYPNLLKGVRPAHGSELEAKYR